MHAKHKVFDNSCKHDLADKLHGSVMVFSGRLSDNSQAIAKLPATSALFDQEVGIILPLRYSVDNLGTKIGRLTSATCLLSSCRDMLGPLNTFFCGFLPALVLMLHHISELEQAEVDTWWVQVQNLKLVGSWPELSGSVVPLRGIGRTKSFPRQLLILQPVGCLVSRAMKLC